MTPDLKILDSFSTMARHAAERHKVLAENIANADTPGYKAQDVQPFAEYYSRVRLEGSMAEAEIPVTRMETESIVSPNGNNVSLDEQMLKTAETKGQHDMALAVYRKTLDLFRLALGKGM